MRKILYLTIAMFGLSWSAVAQPEIGVWPDRFDAESVVSGGRAQAKMLPCERSKFAVAAGATLVVDTDSLNAFPLNTLLSSAETSGGTVLLRNDTLVYSAKTGVDEVRDEIRIRSCTDNAGTDCVERTVTVLVGRRGTRQAVTVSTMGGEIRRQGIAVPRAPLFCGSITPLNDYEYARYRELRFTEFSPGDSLRYQSARGSGDDEFEVVVCNSFGTCDTTVITFRVSGPRTTLPFFDDFSYAGPRPDPRLWVEDVVYVNDAYGIRAPSYGVATFDGIDGGGRDYGTGEQDIDQLTTATVDLSQVGSGNLVFLKYYLQTGGRGLAPEEVDKFITQFRRDDGAWVNQRTVVGSRVSRADTFFRYHALPVQGAEFRHRDFQVRFLMRANAAGSNDSWNLDYVRIEQAEDTSRNFRDIALAARPPSPLQPYSHVPYSQFRNRPELLRERLPVELWNHFPITNNVSSSVVVVEDSFGIELLNAGLLTGAQFNLAPGFSRINNTIPAGPLATYRKFAGALSEEQASRLTLMYQLGIDEEQSRLLPVRRNDTASVTVSIRDEYAYDDGSAEQGLRNGKLGERIVVRYEAFVQDTMRGLRFAFPNLSPADADRQLINLHVYIGELGDRNRAPDYEQTFVRPYFPSAVGDTLQALTSYRFEDASGTPTPLVIPPGQFYVGWQQASDVSQGIQVGFDINNDNAGEVFTEFGQGWTQLTAAISKARGSLMIRPVFGSIRTSSGVSEAGTHRFAVYPNPTGGEINIEIDEAVVAPAQYQIFDAVGRLVQQGAFERRLDPGLVAGVYVLRLLTRDSVVIGRERVVVR